MAGDDENNDPYYDPYDDEFGHFTEESLQHFMSDTVPDLSDLHTSHIPLPPPLLPPPSPLLLLPTPPPQAIEITQEPSSSASEFNDNLWPLIENDFAFPLNIFDDPSDETNDNIDIDNVLGENNDDNNVVDSTRLEVVTRVVGDSNGPNFEFGGSSTTPRPQVSEGVFLCTCCNLIRQLIHAKGEEIIRLDIHGGNGTFCHAILDAKIDTYERILQTFHFMGLRKEDVDKYIEDYCLWKDIGGFTLMHDSFAIKQAANDYAEMYNRCILPRREIPFPNEALGVQPLPLHVGLLGEEEEDKKKKGKQRKQTHLAAQRQRTKKLKMKDLSKYFRVPMLVAARKLGLCSTAVKKICRKGAFERWPHRKISSVEKKIQTLTKMLEDAKDAKEKAHIEQQIETLQKEINDFYSRALQDS